MQSPPSDDIGVDSLDTEEQNDILKQLGLLKMNATTSNPKASILPFLSSTTLLGSRTLFFPAGYESIARLSEAAQVPPHRHPYVSDIMCTCVCCVEVVAPERVLTHTPLVSHIRFSCSFHPTLVGKIV
jgi:hypothetical protein